VSPRQFGRSTTIDGTAAGPSEYVVFQPHWAGAQPCDRFGEVGSGGVARRRPLAHPEELAYFGEPGKFQVHP